MRGNTIRKRRLDLGLLQREVAKLLGCDKTSVLNWEKGYTTPAASHMAGVVNFLKSQPFQMIAARKNTFKREIESLTQNNAAQTQR